MFENMDTGLSNLEILQEPEVREDQQRLICIFDG